MTKNEANELLDQAYIKLQVMKKYYDALEKKIELDAIEKANQNQINELLGDIEEAIKNGHVTDVEVRCISDDTLQLWEELSPIMG